jgi:hypothetical protein
VRVARRVRGGLRGLDARLSIFHRAPRPGRKGAGIVTFAKNSGFWSGPVPTWNSSSHWPPGATGFRILDSAGRDVFWRRKPGTDNGYEFHLLSSSENFTADQFGPIMK